MTNLLKFIEFFFAVINVSCFIRKFMWQLVQFPFLNDKTYLFNFIRYVHKEIKRDHSRFKNLNKTVCTKHVYNYFVNL